ncbi:preprotein translocase subunit YajC [Mucilaginibacter boryungensis]|uniref:Sec translocon accessory complex subunit YajC n=1 Tax=Mucilaginibacter boryungensis TaxID=768480 RepID=A0ABR9XHS3_9SPHI|nr:preprotein translocase subunit YajC [Mucilaginibacter boryungensis]MBE9666750.1 preprotein translocase subunit YajC [Mucilaginibacter boryungensis]
MIATVLLQAAGGGLGSFGSIVPMILIIVVFYFFMIRPQVKKQKDQKKYVEDLKIGDKVVTTAGIHGKIATITDLYFLVEVDNNVKIKFDKSAISLEASKALNTPPAVSK